MTVGELRKKIKNLPAKTPIYLLIDKYSDDPWDDEKKQWRYVLPMAYVSEEHIYTELGDEYNLIFEPENMY